MVSEMDCKTISQLAAQCLIANDWNVLEVFSTFHQKDSKIGWKGNFALESRKIRTSPKCRQSFKLRRIKHDDSLVDFHSFQRGIQSVLEMAATGLLSSYEFGHDVA